MLGRPLGIFYKLTVIVSAFIVLLAASVGAVLGNIVISSSDEFALFVFQSTTVLAPLKQCNFK
jgi:hypothetical protein